MSVDLWNFATACYRQPGVEAACLRLQAAGADVCLLLCGAWLERLGMPYDPAQAERLRTVAAPWQADVVVPLRRLRQAWREMAMRDSALEGLRGEVKALELAAEREQLRRLEATVGDGAAVSPGEPAWLEALAGQAGQREGEALGRLRKAAAYVGD